jgi:Domain of unknown function (DUF4386)
MLTRGETHDVNIRVHPSGVTVGEVIDREHHDREHHDREHNVGTGLSRHRKTAIIVGVLFIAADVAGVLSRVLTSGLLDGPDYLTRIAANQNRLVFGALCALAMGFLLAAIPLATYPIFRKYNEPLAMGYVVFRSALETVTYIAGATSWLLLVALSRNYVKAGSPDTPQFGTVGALLLKAQGQGSIAAHMTSIVFSLGMLMFAYLFYQSRLIPRWLSIWGIVGALLYLADPLTSLFGFSGGFLEAPGALQEIVLAVWLIAKGFDSAASEASPVLVESPR